MTTEEELQAEIKRVRAIIKECEGTKVLGELTAIRMMQEDITEAKKAIHYDDEPVMKTYLSFLKKWELLNNNTL